MNLAYTFYKDNTGTVRLKGLFDEEQQAYLNDATVRMESILDAEGSTIAGQAFPVALAYDAGTDGEYVGTLSHQLQVEAGAEYTAVVTAAAGGAESRWQLTLKVYERTATPVRS